MTYSEYQARTNDDPHSSIAGTKSVAPPLVELAVALHEVEEGLGSIRSQIEALVERRAELMEQRHTIRAKLSDLLGMSDHEAAEAAEARPARPTF